MQQALASTNSALEDLRKNIDDVLQRHSQDATTNQLRELKQFVDGKLKTLCDIQLAEPSSGDRPAFAELVRTMKKEKTDIENAKKDLDQLISNQAGGRP